MKKSEPFNSLKRTLCHYLGTLFVCISISSSSFAADKVTCYKDSNGSIPKNMTTGDHLGEYYFTDPADCKSSIRYASSGVICTGGPNEGNASPFAVSSKQFLGGYYFLSIDDCDRAIKPASSGVICVAGQKTDETLAFDLHSNSTTDKFDSLDDCLDTISPTRSLQWDAKQKTCTLVGRDGKVLLAKTPRDCSSDKNARYYWNDTNRSVCQAFSPLDEFIEAVDSAKCQKSGLYVNAGGKPTSLATASIGGVSYHLIPEVLRLKDGQAVPSDVYTRYSSALIGASIVQRLHLSRETDANEAAPAYDYRADAIIQMKINDVNFDSMAKSGFLNQHKIQSSSGAYTPNTRGAVEDNLLHTTLEADYVTGIANPVNFIRPKYAFLAFPKDSDGQQHSNFLRQYGNVVLVFNEEIKDRSTFTAADSLDKDTDGNGDVDSGIVARTFFFRSKHQLKKVKDPAGGNYWETQIYGELQMSDVSYALVGCPGDTRLGSGSLDRLKKIGLPIYQCTFVKDHSHFAKGAQVFAGDPSAAPTPRPQSGSDTAALIEHKE